jgi:hypothetical protein
VNIWNRSSDFCKGSLLGSNLGMRFAKSDGIRLLLAVRSQIYFKLFYTYESLCNDMASCFFSDIRECYVSLRLIHQPTVGKVTEATRSDISALGI